MEGAPEDASEGVSSPLGICCLLCLPVSTVAVVRWARVLAQVHAPTEQSAATRPAARTHTDAVAQATDSWQAPSAKRELVTQVRAYATTIECRQ